MLPPASVETFQLSLSLYPYFFLFLHFLLTPISSPFPLVLLCTQERETLPEGSTLEKLIIILGLYLGGGDTEPPHIDDYIVLLRRAVLKDGHERRTVRSFSLNCLNSAVGASPLLAARTVILTSGTLSPLTSFASELGVAFSHTLEAEHVIDSKQVNDKYQRQALSPFSVFLSVSSDPFSLYFIIMCS